MIKTKAACAIAEIDRVSFNQWVSDGVYPVAPKTRSKMARKFNAADLQRLILFGRLLRIGLKPKTAGSLTAQYGEGLDGGASVVEIDPAGERREIIRCSLPALPKALFMDAALKQLHTKAEKKS